ncbi:unnamed protein product [Sphagnum tenellum]
MRSPRRLSRRSPRHSLRRSPRRSPRRAAKRSPRPSPRRSPTRLTKGYKASRSPPSKTGLSKPGRNKATKSTKLKDRRSQNHQTRHEFAHQIPQPSYYDNVKRSAGMGRMDLPLPVSVAAAGLDMPRYATAAAGTMQHTPSVAISSDAAYGNQFGGLVYAPQGTGAMLHQPAFPFVGVNVMQGSGNGTLAKSQPPMGQMPINPFQAEDWEPFQKFLMNKMSAFNQMYGIPTSNLGPIATVIKRLMVHSRLNRDTLRRWYHIYGQEYVQNQIRNSLEPYKDCLSAGMTVGYIVSLVSEFLALN